MKYVAVGTTNPVKLAAVKVAFSTIWPEDEWMVNGYAVESGISSQPLSPTEAITGARNRCRQAMNRHSKAAFGVGIEGGLEENEGQWFDCGWCVVRDTKGVETVSSSARIPTPDMMMKYIRRGMELGDVLDLLVDRKMTKQQEGHVGILTNSLVTRTGIYRDAVMIALGRFLHPELFEPDRL